MEKYIKAEELAEHKFFGVTFDRYVSDGRPKSEEEIYAYKVGYNDAIDRIVRFAPTADVVEVVRCKDCKHYIYSNEKCNIIDTRLNFYATGKTWTNDCFCAWGERREDVEETD